MSSNKENSPEERANKAEEPSEKFKTVRIFNSFEEENEYTIYSYAKLSPEERLASVTHLRLTAHPHLEKDLWPWGNNIYFD